MRHSRTITAASFQYAFLNIEQVLTASDLPSSLCAKPSVAFMIQNCFSNHFLKGDKVEWRLSMISSTDIFFFCLSWKVLCYTISIIIFISLDGSSLHEFSVKSDSRLHLCPWRSINLTYADFIFSVVEVFKNASLSSNGILIKSSLNSDFAISLSKLLIAVGTSAL